jgi:type II secretory pathway component PulC
MRCGSVLRQAGLENGDVIQSINGTNVHSIPTAISAYTKLRSKNVLRLTVSRDGEILHIKYKLS